MPVDSGYKLHSVQSRPDERVFEESVENEAVPSFRLAGGQGWRFAGRGSGSEWKEKRMKETALMEAVGCIIAGCQEATMEILDKKLWKVSGIWIYQEELC